MANFTRLYDFYSFPGFVPAASIRGIFGDPYAVVVTLRRRRKKTCCGQCGASHRAFYDQVPRTVRDLDCGGRRVFLEFPVRRVFCRHCHAVKREHLDWVADNPHYTRRFAIRVGRYCRLATVKDVAEDWHLDWHTVKDLDKTYMQEQLDRAGNPAPEVIGIDELSIGPRHTYRIVVSDLLRRRPIWFGVDRSEASMDAFFAWLGPEKSQRIRLAVMDMWKAFRASTLKPDHAPQAQIIFDKFHVLRHLNQALDTVRKQEYAGCRGPTGASSKARSTTSCRGGTTCMTRVATP
jgi:transposase